VILIRKTLTSGSHLSATDVSAGPACQRQCCITSCPDWLLWAAVFERVGRLKSRPDRRCPNSPPRLAVPTTPSRPPLPETPSPGPKPSLPPCLKSSTPPSTSSVRRSPPCRRRPRSSCHPTPPSTPSCHAGEPRHAFPSRLPCAGEFTAVGQACRATSARCAGPPSWAAPWAACAAPAEAELGRALRGRGPHILCARGPSRRCERGPSATVQLDLVFSNF
jgi:hypothetical protein